VGEALLEKHRELRIGRILVAAGGAIGEVRIDRCRRVRGEVSATAIDEIGAYFAAVHDLHLE